MWWNYGYCRKGTETRPAKFATNLFASGELAKELLEVVSDFEKRLTGFLEKSEQTESAEEHRKFKLAVGAVLYELGQQFLFPVFRRHKELIPEEQKGELL